MVKFASSLLVGALFLVESSHAFIPSGNTRVASPVAFVKTRSTAAPLTPASPSSPSASASSSSSSSSVLFMGWGPDPEWSEGKVLSNDAACPSEICVSLKVDVPADVSAEYKVPGQYVQVRLNEETKPLFLAIASAPPGPEESTQFEFLVKKTDDNDWMTDIAPGASLQVSQIMGGGFPAEENLEGFKYDFPTQNVLLFAAGSGIAPIKAAMEDESFLKVAKAGAGGRTARVYYGVRHPDDLCFVNQFPKWEENGFQVVPVLSDPPEAWQGRSGYVQNVLEEDGVPIPRNSGALLCGMKGMADSVKDILIKAGMFEGRILTNF